MSNAGGRDPRRRMQAKLQWVKKFIEYARYELQPGESQLGDQFPRQADADKAMATIDEVVADLDAVLGVPSEDDARGLSIDMLDVDRLREWARLLLVHGADISHWASVPFVASKLQTLATNMEKAIRDNGALRDELAVLRGGGPDPQDDAAELRRALEADVTDLWRVTNAIKDELRARWWITESRGSYEYDDERYRDETRHAFEAITKILDGVQAPASTRFLDVWRKTKSAGGSGGPDLTAKIERKMREIALMAQPAKLWAVLEKIAAEVGAGAVLPPPSADPLRERLQSFVERERALHEARGKGGQIVGYSPSVTISVVKELERMLRDTEFSALPPPSYSREEFERDRFGETGEKIAAQSSALPPPSEPPKEQKR